MLLEASQESDFLALPSHSHLGLSVDDMISLCNLSWVRVFGGPLLNVNIHPPGDVGGAVTTYLLRSKICSFISHLKLFKSFRLSFHSFSSVHCHGK